MGDKSPESVCLSGNRWTERQTDRHTDDVKTITPVADAGCNNFEQLNHCIPATLLGSLLKRNGILFFPFPFFILVHPVDQGWNIGIGRYSPYRQSRYIGIGIHSCRYDYAWILVNPRTVFKITDVTRFLGSVWTPMLIWTSNP